MLLGIGSTLSFRRLRLLHTVLLLHGRVLLHALIGRLHHRLRDLAGGLRLRAVAATAGLAQRLLPGGSCDDARLTRGVGPLELRLRLSLILGLRRYV